MVVKSDVAEKLASLGVLTQDDVVAIVQEVEGSGVSFQKAIVRLGYLSEDRLLEFLTHIYSVDAVNPVGIEVPPQILRLVPADLAVKYNAIPVYKHGRTLSMAMSDPTDMHAIDDLKFITGFEIKPMVATESSLAAALEEFYQSQDDLEDMVKDLGDEDIELIDDQQEDDEGLEEAEQAPVIKFVNSMIADAVRKHVSDIHIEPADKFFRVRFRIDGTLHEVIKQPAKMKNAIISRVKIMSEMNIAEKRLPQDGRIKVRLEKKTVDIRVSTLPTVYGEKVVMRLLDKGNLTLDLDRFGFQENALKHFIEAVESPYGMVLVTGPTGSGKTTTLYSALSRINKVDVNIMTAEDPVEYNLDGINQVQMHDSIGLTFANTLRSFLRQDPNIVMVGEIRDSETGSIAVKAALTGHLVLSTVHTNDAPSTVDRLVDMGIEPFLVASSVNLVLAQRLVRKVCNKCRSSVDLHPEAFMELGIPEAEGRALTFYKGRGCSACNGTGYSGRQGLFEVMPITPEIRSMILDRQSSDKIKKQAMAQGMLTLRQDAVLKLRAGITTVEEVLRETAKDK